MVYYHVNKRKKRQVIDKCKFCGLRGLVLSTINADYSCEHCGEWQNAVLNDIWAIINYTKENKNAAL
jgi:hypothetical protein